MLNSIASKMIFSLPKLLDPWYVLISTGKADFQSFRLSTIKHYKTQKTPFSRFLPFFAITTAIYSYNKHCRNFHVPSIAIDTVDSVVDDRVKPNKPVSKVLWGEKEGN